MNFGNLFKIAVKALGNNRMRGFLTMLGVIIGVASVITMLAIGQGTKKSIQSEISEMGSNMIMIHPGGDMRGGVRLNSDEMESLKLKDFNDIRNNTKYVKYVSPMVNSAAQAVYGANNTPTTVYGVNLDYLDIRNYAVEAGDVFSDQDIKVAAKVCLIGKTVADELFPDGTSPVGKVIRFGTIPFRVVGLLESKGYNSMGMDQDNMIIAPYTTVQKRILAITHVQEIICSALSEEYTTILLSAVAGISLLVGGIGIMNIMYVSVTERTKEIGLRMSIGAKGRDILAQFLIEAVLISVTGGVIGVLFGVAASLVVNFAAHFPIFIQPWSVVLSFAVCTLTGVFFGWYPARKASMLDPIDAIRYE